MYTEQLNTDEQDDEGGSVFVREKEEIDDLVDLFELIAAEGDYEDLSDSSS